jgi:hypothetical protein
LFVPPRRTIITSIKLCRLQALGPVAELESTWFEEAGVKEVTKAAAQAAKRELDGWVLIFLLFSVHPMCK